MYFSIVVTQKQQLIAQRKKCVCLSSFFQHTRIILFALRIQDKLYIEGKKSSSNLVINISEVTHINHLISQIFQIPNNIFTTKLLEDSKILLIYYKIYI